jgi:PE family
MTSPTNFSMQPTEVADAARQLDDLASRFERLMSREASNLTVIAPGRDEVSQRVAATMNEVHATFAKSADQGVTELREVAATIRAHTNDVVDADATV